MVDLYTKEYINIIDENIDKIVDDSRKKEIEVLDPKLSEYKKVMKYLELFVEKKLLLYKFV